jgi:hypothetical protein
MTFSIAPLLIHSDGVPVGARDALRAAYEAPVEHRGAMLESAARILYDETDLECSDIRELVGLSGDGNCG